MFFSYDGEEWAREPGVVVTAISTDSDLVVAATKDGVIRVYEYDNKANVFRCTKDIQTAFDLFEIGKDGMYRSMKTVCIVS